MVQPGSRFATQSKITAALSILALIAIGGLAMAAVDPAEIPAVNQALPENQVSVDIAPPLTRVEEGMRKAEGLIEGQDAGGETRVVQEKVVADLDALIAALEKECEACKAAGSKPGSKPSAVAKGRSPAQDSTTQFGAQPKQPSAPGEVNALVKDVWGQLPERDREQMLQSFSDEFLPEYQLEIEQYFRRLAEEGAQNDPSR